MKIPRMATDATRHHTGGPRSSLPRPLWAHSSSKKDRVTNRVIHPRVSYKYQSPCQRWLPLQMCCVCRERRGFERICVAMENMEVLVRGLVMQNAGASMGLGSVSFQGVQLQVLWVVAVAAIVLALVSVTRVNYVSVGWSWGSKPGQVRVRVQSFSSVLEDGIQMFSAEILNCSADSCSEDASSSVAEAMFIFEKKKQSGALLPKQASVPAVRAPPEKIVRKRSKSLDFQKIESLQRSKSFDLQELESLLLADPPAIGAIAVSRPTVLREGIVWEASPAATPAACGVVGGENSRVQSCINSPMCAVPRKSACYEEFDPLLKLRIRDAVVGDCMSSFSVRDVTFPLAPVAVRDAEIAALGDGVVRVWDSETRCLRKSVLFPKGADGAVTAFDVRWGLEAVVIARKGGLLSLVDLESAAYESFYEARQSVVQAVHFGSSPFSKTMFSGGPSPADPGCFVALWDSRSSKSELTLDFASASTIHGILSRGVELYVRDEAGSLGAHDMRMLGASSFSRVPCGRKLSCAPEDRWWETDAMLEEADDIDDDDFMDCQVAEETKRGSATSMSTLVTVMSRSFSSKALAT